MSWGLFWRMLWRETRGGALRLSLLGACIAIGVAAVVAVAGLTEAVEQGLRLRARELLGGDLALESRRPLPELDRLLPLELRAALETPLGTCTLSSMVRNERGESRLAELKAIEGSLARYPLAGELGLEPARPLSELLDDESVLVAPELMAVLNLSLGDTLHIGERAFRVRAVVHSEPDPLTFSVSLGPRVLMTMGGLEASGLLGFGSRVRYRALFALPTAGLSPAGAQRELARLKQALEEVVPGAGTFVSVETRSDAQPALRRTLERVQRFLGLLALLSLLVSSVGVAQAVSAWLAQAVPQTAVLRCLGLRPREVFLLYLGHVGVTALLGSALGSLISGLLPSLLARIDAPFVPAELTNFVPFASMAYGILLGTGMALCFSLPALVRVWQVPPLSVLRSEASPLPLSRPLRFGMPLCAGLGLFGAAYLQSGELAYAASFTVAIGVLAALLWAGARLPLWGVARLPRDRLPSLVWQGAAAAARPGAGTIGGVLALGMGCLVVLGIALVEGVLSEELQAALPEDAPSMFLVDIQPDQWPSVQRLAQAAGAQKVTSVPVVMARLRAVDGKPVEVLAKERPGDPNEKNRVHWVLTREQRITFGALPTDNTLVAGTLWSDPSVPEVSLEEGFARDLGARVGTTLRFDVQGVPMDFKVTSLRSVVWRSFSMNFFVVAEPGTLDDAPQIRLGGIRLPLAREQALQNELARAHPNVSVIRVRDLLERALDTLAQLGLAVRALGSLAMLGGLLILAGAIASSQLRRAREAALLKALGVTRLRIAALFAIEYALLGAVAGAVGALGSFVMVSQFVRRVLEMSTYPSWRVCLVGLALTVLLSVVSGLLASLRALRVPPLEVLRRA